MTGISVEFCGNGSFIYVKSPSLLLSSVLTTFELTYL
uniref:Uncharacterized protein n=1 Tax=Anguilla anguilla TaxID=7936 RepID=A0A0E9TBV9_ANGAN